VQSPYYQYWPYAADSLEMRGDDGGDDGGVSEGKKDGDMADHPLSLSASLEQLKENLDAQRLASQLFEQRLHKFMES
jgi:hypothetical protein